MLDMLLKFVIGPIVNMVVKNLLTAENYQKYGDKLFDLLEEYIADSETTIDDSFLPVIQQVRELLNIPDLPDED